MGKKDLKKLVRKDSEMQKLVVKVMNELKEEMEKCEEEMREIAKVDYKMVAEVVVEVMKDITEEFKKLVKKDKKMAVMATKMLKDRDLEKLTKDNKEMEEIVREAGSVSDEDLCQNDVAKDEEESGAVLEKVPEAADQNTVREAATKLLTPLGNLLTPLGKLMDDANFKNAVPEAEDVKLGLDAIDGLLLKNRGLKKGMDENTKQHISCFCCAFDLNHFHSRYKMSIAAETMAKHIEEDLIQKCPGHPVTVRIRSIDMKRTPTQFLKGLQSRDRLLQKILKILRDDQVDSVGVYGMGGCSIFSCFLLSVLVFMFFILFDSLIDIIVPCSLFT
ncbi:hypothetical protein RND81_04G144400 [Saponaria officinalis]|uniref:Uncharacterized protein n=1 Tax=Saponaria officinalis TaxID=3572 RepID=A0AAW1LET5_SAPOF